MENKKYVVYLELKGQGLIQTGYLRLNDISKIADDSCLLNPFKLTDKELADTYDNQQQAVNAVRKIVNLLNWGYYSSITRKVEEVSA